MKTTVAQLTDLLEPYSYCPLECDGLTRVFTTLLVERGIAHTVFTGNVTHRGSGKTLFHFWIEVSTSEGRRFIDYRARMWLGSGVEVPHGIFNPLKYPDIVYEGETTELRVLESEIFTSLTTPITQLLESLSYPSPVFYTIGYRQPYAELALRFLVSRGFPVADIRKRAGSRFDKKYNRARLATRFSGMYHRLAELGNLRHNEPGAPVEFQDLQTGIEKSQRIIEAAGRGIVYLCACTEWQTCHRSKAASFLQEALPEGTIVHLQATGSVVVEQQKSKRLV